MKRSLNSGLKKQVHPAVAATLVIAALIAVQWAWWKGLIYKPPPLMPRPGGPTATAGPQVTTIAGSTDATVDTLAGDLDPGDTDGPGHAARFDRPTGLAIDAHGNLYVADTGNHRIRKVAPDGQTTTFAGSTMGSADGPAAQAKFNAPCGVCVAPDGALFVADTGNDSIRWIAPDGHVSTLIGRAARSSARIAPADLPSRPTGVAILPDASQLLVTDCGGRRLIRYALDGKLLGAQPVGAAATAVSCSLPAGHPATEAAGRGASGLSGCGLAIPGSGTLLLGGKSFRNVPLDSTHEAAFTLRHPVGLFPWGQDWLVTDADHPALFLVHDGSAMVMAGSCTSADPLRGSRDGDGSRAQFSILSGVVGDGKQYVYVSDTANNTIRRITMPGD